MQNQTNDFISVMKACKLRVTDARQELFEFLSKTQQPVTAAEITKNLQGSQHFVSVYRNIDALLKAGVVKQVPQGFKNRYELSDLFKPHHHHVTCESCGNSVSVEDPRVESLMKELTKEAGLMPTKHHFELYGICKNCS